MAYELTDEEWSKLEELLPKKKMGRPCLDLRRTLSAIKWILKTGSSWRALPCAFGKWNSEVVLGEVSLDSTFVKVHRHGLGAKKGLSDI